LVIAFLLSLGFQLKHKATCRGGGCLTRHSHYVRVRLGGVTIWRLQCTTCRAVFTILPHFVLRCIVPRRTDKGPLCRLPSILSSSKDQPERASCHIILSHHRRRPFGRV
jgi:hypothetical protein